MVNVKTFCFFGKRVNHDCTYTNIFSDPVTTKYCIVEQIST